MDQRVYTWPKPKPGTLTVRGPMMTYQVPQVWAGMYNRILWGPKPKPQTLAVARRTRWT
jgi:hypothetical protein